VIVFASSLNEAFSSVATNPLALRNLYQYFQ